MSFHSWEYTSRVRVLYWVQCYFLWKTEESALNKQKCIYNDRWAVLIVILSHISCLKCPKPNKRLLFTEPCHWHSTPRWPDRRLHKFSCLPGITNGNNVFCSSGTSIQTLWLRAVDCHQGLLESMACPPSRTLPWQLKLLASWGCCFSARGAVLILTRQCTHLLSPPSLATFLLCRHSANRCTLKCNCKLYIL